MFEVITTTDKAKRDQMFQDLRRNGDKLERQVVKFSSNEPFVDENGDTGKIVYYSDTRGASTQMRPFCRSTWSIAYPTS
jgi:hypothetical protein